MAETVSGKNGGAPRLMAMAGSMREASVNRRLLKAAARMAEREGAEVETVDLRDLDLPPYDGDAEAAGGLPPGAERLKAAISAADGLLLVTPEYNHSIPGTFKNALDWASRGGGRVYEGKAVALMGASPGAYGAVRAILHLRQVLAAVGAWTVPGMVALPRAADAVDEQGDLKDAQIGGQMEALVKKLIAHARGNAP